MKKLTLTTLPGNAIKTWLKRFDRASRRQIVILEGTRAIREALTYAPTVPRAVFMTHAHRSDSELMRMLSRASKRRSIEIYEVTEQQMKKLSRVETPPGILAVWKVQPVRRWPPEDRGFFAYFYEIRDPGNLGTLFRTALATGLSGLILSPRSVSVYNDKVCRSSMSAILRVPFWINVPPQKLIAFHQTSRIPLIFVHPQQVKSLQDFQWPDRGILIFGGETARLPKIFFSLPGFHIPMVQPMDSLNTAVAASVVFYHLLIQRTM